MEENSGYLEKYCGLDAKGQDGGMVLVPPHRDPLSITVEEIKIFLEILKLVDHVNQPGRDGLDCLILAEF